MLTIGMATHDDYHGVVFTVQSLRLHQDLRDAEIVVIDNNPGSKHGRGTAEFCSDLAGVRYIPFGEQNGTTQTRERIFSEAKGDSVLVMDCHVMFPIGAVARLKQYFADNPETRDILSGPLLINHLRNVHTHFNDVWRGGMWGIWGNAWRCMCGWRFTTLQRGDGIAFADLVTSLALTTICPRCNKAFAVEKWAGHEEELVKAGFQPLGLSNDDPPFEIPGMGLGVFACRKDVWPGFNKSFRGFGGEEMYIHEKFRLKGGRVICLPWLKWWHRFGRPDGTGYVNRTWDRVRNYVLGHKELGRSLDPIYRQFVSLGTFGDTLIDHLRYEHGDGDDKINGKNEDELLKLHQSHCITEESWEFLLADPEGHLHPAGSQQAVSVQLDSGRQQPPAGATLDEIFDWCKGIKRDLDEHLPRLKELASKCDHVTELTKRRESTVALLAGRPLTMVSYQREKDVLVATVSRAAVKPDGSERVVKHVIHWGADSLGVNAIDETDMLFIDTIHTGDRLTAELALHAGRVRRFIVMRGTAAFGERGECPANQQCPGLFHGLRPWMAAHPDWFVVSQADNEYGLTVIGRLEEDRPEKPVNAWPPGYGPGTELKKLLATMGVNPSPSCDCNAKAALMDKWGVDTCKAERAKIVGWLTDGAPRWNWTEKIAAAARAVASGLAFKLSLADPYGSLVDQAIRQAEQSREGTAA